ncbi:hypothetical protein [Nocardia sp. NPDC048505]|uniref:hypothetical protein n=1 Tax=unclassified Nocardia TaxID=2637762 RepID=UPI0033CF596F
MISRKTLGTVAVSAALIAPVTAAPAYAETPKTQVQYIDDSGSSTGSAGVLLRDGLELVVCLLKGQFVGSKYPLC